MSRTHAALAAVGVALAVTHASVAQGQTPAAKAISAQLEAPAKGFVQPKTTWGEPDLQGVWTSDAALGIPRERPDKFGVRAMLTDEEFSEAQKADEKRRKGGENAVSIFRNDDAWKTKSYRQTSLVIEPENGRTPAFTAEAQKRAAPRDRGSFGEGPFNTPEDFTLYDRCITRGIVGSVLRVVYGNGNRIVQAPGVVVLSYEMLPDSRVIYTDGRKHINTSIKQYLGDSRAHWEGEELVVETTNLTNKTAIGVNGNGVRHSEQMVITERFRRIADGVIQYQATYDDPVTYATPFTVSFPLTPLDGGNLLPYDCHPGNTAISMSLSAERAEDRAVAADAAKGIVRQRRTVQDDGAGVGAALPAGRGGPPGGRGGRAGGPPPAPGVATGENDVEK